MNASNCSSEGMAHDEVAFPVLNDAEIHVAEKFGRRERLEAGRVLFEPGQQLVDLLVILDGSLELIDTSGDQERILAVHGTRGFVGEISLLTRRRATSLCRVKSAAEVIRIPVDALRRLLVSSASFGEKWMTSLLRRREVILARGVDGLHVFGDRADAATLRLREFVHRNGVPHRWIDTDDQNNIPVLATLGKGPFEFPVIAWSRKVLMQNPSLPVFADFLGVRRSIPKDMFDTVIIGGGPAGLGAAVYAASEGLHTLVLDQLGPGGQAGSSSRIENYAGFPAGVSGTELAVRSYLQALKFGALFSAPCDVAEIRRAEDGLHSVHLQDGSVANTKTVIVATGVRYRSLGVEGLSKLSGTGVYYSATHVEALLCDERPLHVIGAGNSAGQAAMFLSRFNARVNLIVRGSDLRKSMSSYLAERVQANSRIHVRLHSELRAVTGADSLEQVSIENVATSKTTVEDSCAVFIFIGATPCTDFLGDRISKDEKGFLITGAELIAKGTWSDPNRLPHALETSCPGIFAAGDCRSGTTKRVASAVGDGALAVTCVHDLLGTYA
jgi:thioredoxin reductase (NADPH)